MVETIPAVRDRKSLRIFGLASSPIESAFDQFVSIRMAKKTYTEEDVSKVSG